MALHHASSGEVIDLAASADQPGTRAIVKTDRFEAIRLALGQGDTIPAHRLASQITLHCLEGSVSVKVAGGMLTLGTGQWVFFDENAVHGIDAVTDSVLLITIMLPIDTPT
ncbi:cupin domain-containing protein [Sphingobium cupriresistens]|uniref:Cupin n=1 Tax=Sphingobium cupriresistens TaxID=1132417 RepID=A0A8G1ZGW9_9SPHN|nr:cupin domain-containing protein [Sphingobium cupriresistens]RYM10735.1 cupin [Sphingobium cupriresistens]